VTLAAHPITPSMPMYRQTLAVALAATLLAGCAAETPERRAARREAHRDACIATELLIHSHDRSRSLGEFSGGAMAQVLKASGVFVQAYDDYAQARAAQLAYADSAAQAETSGDSTRMAAESRSHTPPAAAPGSVQATAAQRYQDDFAAAKANPDFPCNKPDEEAPAKGS
jgi:hypothetical protein